MKRKLLLTGASGRIGQCLAEGLSQVDNYELVLGDIRPDDSTGVIQLNVTDADRFLELTKGVDTVLHFAWDRDHENFLGTALSVNVAGAYHLYEAARVNGVKRVIFASSNHATGFYEVGVKLNAEEPYRPDSIYGLSKCYIELLGRYYADKYGISSINLRIGNFPQDNQPHSERASHIWISNRDMVQLTQCCIEADPSIDFLCLYGTSANSDNYYEIDHLEELIGYKPQDNATFLVDQAQRRNEPIRQDETRTQGGKTTYKDQLISR